MTFDRRILWLALLTGLPGSLIALVLLATGDFTPRVSYTLGALIIVIWLGLAFSLRRRVVMPLQTLSNMIAALGEGDFSIRARRAGRGDSLGEVMLEINALAGALREQRLGSLEAATLLRKMMEEIDVAVFAFDEEMILRLVNRAGERLLTQPAERLVGHRADELGLSDCLTGDSPRTLDIVFPGATGRWEARRASFRQGGLPLQMLVLTDLSRALRQEERQAWQRLIRVIGHELNNSLAPIRSIAGSLESLLAREPRPPDWEEDMRRGLAVVAARSDALNRFMEGYARLARLPQPRLGPVDLPAVIRRVTAVETRLPVAVMDGPECVLQADGDQIEQALINLVRNAADAAIETGGGVRITWRRDRHHADVIVTDDGPGLSGTENLFVPFFTTKPGGSGIGLALSRQIAEAHGGSLTLVNRVSGPGCEARLRLPL